MRKTVFNEKEIFRFSGNETHIDHFQLLDFDSSTLLVGSRNVLYNISMQDLSENRMKRIVWFPSVPHKEWCYIKGQSEEYCQNYVRVGARVNSSDVVICGTNAFKPLCRQYRFSNNSISFEEWDGKGWVSNDPNHNSTYVYAGNQMYTATVTSLGSLIFRKPLRTDTSDLHKLNDPNFVSAMEYGDYILFFFRESAVEYMNCGKVIYSRVARVCKKDKGGKFSNFWTSFVKARLNCSIPGDYPFYFNEIQATSNIINGKYRGNDTQILYAIFTTPPNSIGGSALCAFSMDEIMASFDGSFKEQSSLNSNWLAVPAPQISEPRPGTCVDDSRTLPDASVNFIKAHPLMDKAVPSFKEPLLFRLNLKNYYTAIAVDPQVKMLNGSMYDVIFIGTNDGKIVKVINLAHQRYGGNFVEEIVIPLPKLGSPSVKSIMVKRDVYGTPRLVVVTSDLIQSLPVQKCASIETCRDCAEDPYCAWNSHEKSCVVLAEFVGDKRHLVQNVDRGFPFSHCNHQRNEVSSGFNLQSGNDQRDERIDKDFCPKCPTCKPSDCSGGALLDDSESGGLEKIVIYTADKLWMVVASSVMATLVIGFIAGYFCSRRFKPDNAYTNMHIHQHNSGVNGEGASYLPPCANNKASINLVMNVPPKNANDKNSNTSENNKTLQKVKKTYI